MTKPRFPGIAVRLSDGNEYVIPKLLYAARADLEKRHPQPAADELELIQDTVFAALKRNYPEMTLEQSNALIEGKLQDGALRLVIAGLCRGVVSLGCTHQRSN